MLMSLDILFHFPLIFSKIISQFSIFSSLSKYLFFFVTEIYYRNIPEPLSVMPFRLLGFKIPRVVFPLITTFEKVLYCVRRATYCSGPADLLDLLFSAKLMGIFSPFTGGHLMSAISTMIQSLFLAPMSENSPSAFTVWRDWITKGVVMKRSEAILKKVASLMSLLALAPFFQQMGLNFSSKNLDKSGKLVFDRLSKEDKRIDNPLA
jgi:hypothetical protein